MRKTLITEGICLIFICFMPFCVTGQIEYFSNDSAISIVRIVNGGELLNARFCQVKIGERIIMYSPLEVKEYSLKNGRFYRSYPVKCGDSVVNFFLERLSAEKISLYYLHEKVSRKRYFYVKDEKSLPIEFAGRQGKYLTQLDSLMAGCTEISKKLPFVKLKKYHLVRIFRDYAECSDEPFPRIRFGFRTGAVFTRFSAVSKGSVYDYSGYGMTGHPAFSFSGDFPVRAGNFSFHPEVQFSRISKAYSMVTHNKDHDLILNYSSVVIPLFVRYSAYQRNLTPYFQAGPAYSRALQNESFLLEYTRSSNDVFVDEAGEPALQDDHAGFSAAGGLILKHGSKYSLFCEAGYTRLWNIRIVHNGLSMSEFSFGLGLIF